MASVDSSNTAPKQRGKPFTKGDDRINRNGRPRSFDALRKLAQEIAHEVAKEKDKPVIIDNHEVTMAESILRQWASSAEPQLQVKFVEIAFGKVPNSVELTGKDGKDFIPAQVTIFIPENGRQ